MPSPIDCAYAAGFFDGEGSVMITRRSQPRCQAAVFLRDIAPYLKVKREQAELAICFQGSRINPGGRGHSSSAVAQFEATRLEMFHLKKIATKHPTYAAEAAE